MIKVAISVVAVILVVRVVRPEALMETAARADPVWILAAVALLPMNLLLETAIWLPLLRVVAPDVSFYAAVRAVVAGFPLGFVTPGRVGEFVGRPLALSDANRIGIGLSVMAARVPELAILLAVGSLVVVGGAATAGSSGFPGQSAFAAAAIIATGIVWFAILFPQSVVAFAGRVLPRLDITGRLAFLGRVDRSKGIAVLSRSALRMVVYCAQFLLLARAFDSQLAVRPAAEAVVATFTAKTIIPPITLFDVGIREGAAAFFFEHAGIGAAVGFDAAFMLFVINIVVPTLIGLPLVYRYRLGQMTNAAKLSEVEIV